MRINVASSVNSKYSRYLYVMLLSLFKADPDDEIHVYVLQRDLSKKERADLSALSEQYDNHISFLSVDVDRFPNVPTSEKFSIEAYFRLMLTELMPKDVGRILYLDVDVIVRSSISELYDTDLEQCIAGVCQDMDSPLLEEHKRILFGRREDLRYFNSGVMLIDLDRLRQHYSFEVFMNGAEELGYSLQYADQEILNYLWYDKVKYLPSEKYNFMVRGDMAETDLESDNIIIHFSGCNPWQVGGKCQLYTLWWKYAESSPYYTDLLREQLWRTEGFDEKGAVSLSLSEERDVYKTALFLKGKGIVAEMINEANSVIGVYGCGAMAEVLYELFDSDDIWDRVVNVTDRSRRGEFHGVSISRDIINEEHMILIITPIQGSHEIVEELKDKVKTSTILTLKQFLYKAVEYIQEDTGK